MQATCNKCGRHPRRENQRWCKFCMADSMVKSRERHRKRINDARQFIIQAAEFVPETMRERARELVETL